MFPQIKSQQHTSSILVMYLAVFCLLAVVSQQADASQGCPFNDNSCGDYCKEQGCNLGYCGHFAWLQCICRKCGQEWEWYDKVHVNEGKQVNQTELESLNLNVTNTKVIKQKNEQQQQILTKQQQENEALRTRAEQQHASLAAMLIPDLSDNSKFEDEDIPEEGSEKFLDFLAKNHEKLAKATVTSSPSPLGSLSSTNQINNNNNTAANNGLILQDAPQAEEIEVQIKMSSPIITQIVQLEQQDTVSQTTTQAPSDVPSVPPGLLKLLRMAPASAIPAN